MRKYLAPIVAAVVVALVVGTFAIAGPGIGITKTAPLSGNGSDGSPLKITVCSNGQVYQSNGTSWVCTAAGGGGGSGTVTSIATTSPITGGPITTTGTIGLSIAGASCLAGQIMTAIGATGTGTCTAIGTAGGTTGTGTANTVAKWTGTTALGNSSVTDNGTTWAINTNKVTCTEASGNCAMAGTLDVVGALTENSSRVFSATGTGLTSSTNTVTLNMAGASCSAGSFVSAITATGGTTCTAEPGDITAVVAGTNMTGGGTSGSVTLNLADTVSLAGTSNTNTLTVNNTATGQTSAMKIASIDSSTATWNVAAGNRSVIGLNIDTTTSCLSNCTPNGMTSTGLAVKASSSGYANNGYNAIYATTTSGTPPTGGGFSGYFDQGSFQVNGQATFATTVFTQGNVLLGNDSSDVITFSNGPVGVNSYDGKHLEWSDEWMVFANNAGIFAQSTGDISGPVGSIYQVQWNSTGAFLADETGVTARPGIMGMNTGAATAGGVALTTSLNSVDFGSGSWTYEIVVGWPVLSVVAQEFWSVFGFIDTAGGINQVDGCYFAYDRLNTATAGPNAGNVDALECWCASNSTRTKYLINASGNSDESFALGTGTIAALTYPNTNIYRLKIVMTGTTRAEFYRNGTKVCDINTNIPSGSSRLTGAGIVHNKSAGTTGRLMDVDYTRVAVDLTTARSP